MYDTIEEKTEKTESIAIEKNGNGLRIFVCEIKYWKIKGGS